MVWKPQTAFEQSRCQLCGLRCYGGYQLKDVEKMCPCSPSVIHSSFCDSVPKGKSWRDCVVSHPPGVLYECRTCGSLILCLVVPNRRLRVLCFVYPGMCSTGNAYTQPHRSTHDDKRDQYLHP